MITKQEAEIIQNIAIAVAAECEGESICTDTSDNFWDTDDEWGPTKLAKELAKTFKIKTSSGCYRTAFILSNVVVKISKEPRRMAELESEAKYIQKMRKNKKYGRHFPQTEVFKVGKAVIQIQEKVDMKHRGASWLMADAVEDLAEHLGIDDCHSGNYGWKKGPNGKYPVFVDVDFRNSGVRIEKRSKKRSWEV